MKKIILGVLLMVLHLSAHAQLNITQASNLDYSGLALSNIGGYVDTLGNEYALVGYYNGLSIVNVTNPANPQIVFDVPGTHSDWREVKTSGKYAYVTTEGCCNGLQIIDLSNLPASVNSKFWNGDGAILNQLNTIHALHIDNGYAYLFGSNLFGGAALIVDITNPWFPTYVSHTPGSYIHDGYVRNDTLYGGHIYDGYFSIIDVTNKLNPTILTTKITPGQFTHNTWLNDAGNAIFTTDEVTDSYLTSYDISNINNINELDRIQLTPGSGSIVHNTHTLNDFEVVSWYKDGIAIVDVSHPDNMVVVGSYDTYTQGSGSGYDGAWGVYPFLPSGNLLVSDMSNGLFVLTPTYVRACYLQGNVTDSITGTPINSVTVSFIGQTTSKKTKINGDYKTGLATPGLYDVSFSKAGYVTKVITGVSLATGVIDTLNVQLNEFNFTGSVLDSVSGTGIANATVFATDGTTNSTVLTDNAGNFVFNNLTSGTYDLTIVKWGFVTQCTSVIVDGITPQVVHLSKGYYDDFSTDNGWTTQSTTSSGLWTRAIPFGTSGTGGFANPNVDVSGDCGTYAWVTGNSSNPNPNADDVDDGITQLFSPQFDGTLLPNSAISYSTWLYMPPNVNVVNQDTLFISLDNGSTSVLIDAITAGPQSHGNWFTSTKKISDYLTPTSTMHMAVYLSDKVGSGNILEAGFDQFSVFDGTLLGVHEQTSAAGYSVYPNPFTLQLQVALAGATDLNGLTYSLRDLSGRIVVAGTVTSYEMQIPALSTIAAGTYLFTLEGPSTKYTPQRIVKTQ